MVVRYIMYFIIYIMENLCSISISSRHWGIGWWITVKEYFSLPASMYHVSDTHNYQPSTSIKLALKSPVCWPSVKQIRCSISIYPHLLWANISDIKASLRIKIWKLTYLSEWPAVFVHLKNHMASVGCTLTWTELHSPGKFPPNGWHGL